MRLHEINVGQKVSIIVIILINKNNSSSKEDEAKDYGWQVLLELCSDVELLGPTPDQWNQNLLMR